MDPENTQTTQPIIPIQPEPIPTVPPAPVPVEPTLNQPTLVPTPSKSKLPMILGVIILIVVSAGILLAKSGTITKLTAKPTSTPIPTQVPVSSPTPDPTADWKIYENTTYGYLLKYPSTLTVVPDTGWKEPENLSEATGITIRNQNLPNPLETPRLSVYSFLPENTVYKGLTTVKEIADANLKDNNHPETLIRIIKPVHEIQFSGESAFQYSMESKGFFAGWSGAIGEQGIVKIITVKHNEKYFQLGLYDTPVYNQILSTFRFLDQNQTSGIESWKTYTNTRNKYSFKYPEYFQYLAENPDGGVYLAPSEGTGEGKGSPFGLDLNKDSWFVLNITKLDDAGLTYWRNYLTSRKSNVIVNGINGYKNKVLPKEASEPAYGYETVILNNNILYKLGLIAGSEKLGYLPEKENLFDQILSTFKFTL